MLHHAPLLVRVSGGFRPFLKATFFLVAVYAAATTLVVPQVSCSFLGSASVEGRPVLASVFWRLRNHPFSEKLVAKYGLMTGGGLGTGEIAKMAELIGAGVYYFSKYLSTLPRQQREYVWAIAVNTDASQYFVNKFHRAQELVGKPMSPGEVFLHVKYVLDGHVNLPVEEGFNRFLVEQYRRFRRGYFAFASEVADALLKRDIRRLTFFFRDSLPLLKLCLASLLSLSKRTVDPGVREAQQTVARWIEKFFRLDTTLLSLCPNAPPQVLQERLALSRGFAFPAVPPHPSVEPGPRQLEVPAGAMIRVTYADQASTPPSASNNDDERPPLSG